MSTPKPCTQASMAVSRTGGADSTHACPPIVNELSIRRAAAVPVAAVFSCPASLASSDGTVSASLASSVTISAGLCFVRRQLGPRHVGQLVAHPVPACI